MLLYDASNRISIFLYYNQGGLDTEANERGAASASLDGRQTRAQENLNTL